MFKNAKDVANYTDEQLAAFIRGDNYTDVLTPELEQKLRDAHKVVNTLEEESMAIAKEIHRRLSDSEIEPRESSWGSMIDIEDDLQDFMYEIASDLGREYDSGDFWIPSTC